MQILYVDESGVEDLCAGTSHFVLLGLMVPAERWKQLDEILDRIKARYELDGVEIHTGWMARRYSEQESIAGFVTLARPARRAAVKLAIRARAGVIGVRGDRRKIKSYRRESHAITPYVHLTRDDRLECLEALAREIASWGTVRIFGEAVSKRDFTPRTFNVTPYELAFEQVLTRYQAHLARMNDSGIVVHDNNATAAPRLTRLSRTYHRVGTFYRQIANIVETPLFVDSSLTSMIQMSDLCAYALRRFIENGETRLWEIVEPRVARQAGVAVGLRHFTGPRTCTCAICVAHGRR